MSVHVIDGNIEKSFKNRKVFNGFWCRNGIRNYDRFFHLVWLRGLYVFGCRFSLDFAVDLALFLQLILELVLESIWGGQEAEGRPEARGS